MDDKERAFLKKFKYAVLSAGAVLSFATALVPGNGGHYAAGLVFGLWAMMPYFIFFAFSWRSDKSYSIVVTGSLVFVMDIIAHFFIFFYGMKAERGIGLMIFEPVWLTLFVLPAGYLLGWLAGRFSEKNEKPG